MLETMGRPFEIIGPEIISKGQKEFEKELPKFVEEATLTKEAIEVEKKEKNKIKWRRIISAAGTLIFLCGTVWKEKEKIFDAGVGILRGPAVSDVLDQQFANRYKMPKALSDKGVKMDSKEEPEPAIDLGDLHLGFPTEDTEKYDNYSKLVDDREKINVTNPYLRNLITPKLVYLKPPENQKKFSKIVAERAKFYLDGLDQGEGFNEIKERRRKGLKDGNVSDFIDLVTFIVDSHFEYDPTTESWHDYSGEKFSFKIGSTNPISAMLSATGSPIDKFLENKKGYCSHFAEAICYVSEEVKRQFPGKFDNIYFTTFTSAYKFHTWNAWFLVKSNQAVEMGVKNYDETENPTYDLLKTLYDRKIITESKFFEICGDYFSNYESMTEEVDDFDGFMEFALYKKTEKSLDAVKKIIISDANSRFQNDYMSSFKKLEEMDEYSNIRNVQKEILSARENFINDSLKEHIQKYNKIKNTDLLQENPFIFPQVSKKSPQEIQAFIASKTKKIQSMKSTDEYEIYQKKELLQNYIYSIVNLVEETESVETRSNLENELEKNNALLLETYKIELNRIDKNSWHPDRDFYDFATKTFDDLFILESQAQDNTNREKIDQLIIKTMEKWEKNIDQTYHYQKASYMFDRKGQLEFITKILSAIAKAEESNEKYDRENKLSDNNSIQEFLKTFKTKYQLLLEKAQNLPE